MCVPRPFGFDGSCANSWSCRGFLHRYKKRLNLPPRQRRNRHLFHQYRERPENARLVLSRVFQCRQYKVRRQYISTSFRHCGYGFLRCQCRLACSRNQANENKIFRSEGRTDQLPSECPIQRFPFLSSTTVSTRIASQTIFRKGLFR